jgi:hypothetical protein
MLPRLFLCLTSLATALVTLNFIYYRSKASMSNAEKQQDSDNAIDVMERPLLEKIEEKDYRVGFGAGPGVLVTGWPSKGGIYILEDCFAIELDFLGLDKFHDTPQPALSDINTAAEEEAHCDRSK